MNKNICIIGSGNVATCMSHLFFKSGHTILQIYSREKQNAEQLAQTFHAAATSNITELVNHADLYFIAVEDKAIEMIAKQLHVQNNMVVHCSGSVEMEILNDSSANIGVLYPLQSFNKSMAHQIPDFNFIIEANTTAANEWLAAFAKTLNRNCVAMTFAERRRMHLAAVFMNNFSNHMIAIGEKILTENNLPVSLIKPLIETTFQKIVLNGAVASQTGPAMRNDEAVMNQHLSLLSDHPQWKKIYTLLNSSISELYH